MTKFRSNGGLSLEEDWVLKSLLYKKKRIVSQNLHRSCQLFSTVMP